MGIKTNICANCGADDGLHQSETQRCPKNGRELPMHLWEKGERQQWEETVFKDSGEKKLEDAAPDLLAACEQVLLLTEADQTLFSKERAILFAAIKKATE